MTTRETGLTVLTDEKWLSFAIEQMLANALKYTREGGGIRIYAEGEALCIEDTGIGIAAEDLPRVFEKGYTGCNGRTDKKSTGIGLSTSAGKFSTSWGTASQLNQRSAPARR